MGRGRDRGGQGTGATGVATPVSRDELLQFLNTMLEAERAGAKVLAALVHDGAAPEGDGLLVQVERDEARYCAMLTRLIKRLGGTPSKATGEFRDKVMALPTLPERLALLNRGQAWVARRLEEMLPRIADVELQAELTEMRDTHRANVAACGVLLDGLAELPARN